MTNISRRHPSVVMITSKIAPYEKKMERARSTKLASQQRREEGETCDTARAGGRHAGFLCIKVNNIAVNGGKLPPFLSSLPESFEYNALIKLSSPPPPPLLFYVHDRACLPA